MTTLTRESIAALSGRELDAAISERLFGANYDGFDPWQQMILLKHYSDSDCRGLAEMIAAARAAGVIRIETTFADDTWDVWLYRSLATRDTFHDEGSTLPEAFARALLLTTLTEATP